MNPKRIITTRGIIYRGGKIFAQKLKKASGIQGYWCIPGGKLDPNESLIDGLYREMLEETGIAPSIGKLLFTQQFADEEFEYLEFFFHIENPDDYQAIDLASTSHGLIEVAECGFIDPKIENLLPDFLRTVAIGDYVNGTEPVLVNNYLD